MSKIGATIALDGEKQFKSAVTSAKQSLKELDSELKLSSTVFKGQANSLDALRQKHDILQRTLDAHKQKSEALQKIVNAEKEKYEKAGTNLDKYSKELEEARDELDRMKSSGTATNEEIDAQQKKVDELSDKVEKSTTAYASAERSVSRWQTQLNDTERDIANTNDALAQNEKYMSEAEKATDNCATSIDNYGKEVKQAKDLTEGFVDEIALMDSSKAISDILPQLADKVSGVAEAAYNAAKELDEGYDAIIKKTGATGKTLEELEDVANNIFGSMSSDMSDVGTAVGEVNTRFGYTGDELEALSSKFLKFADINETDVNTSIDMVQKDLAAFNMDASEAGDLLDAMTSVGQRTGVSMDTLQNSLVSNATVLQELGADAYGSLEFLGELEMSGTDSSAVMNGLSKALNNATKQGMPLSTALENLQSQLVNATDDTEGMRIATELFGSKAAARVYPALKNGTINLKELSQATENYSGIVETTYETTMDAWDEMTIAQNKLKTSGSQLAKSTLSTLAPAYTKASNAFSKFVDSINDAPKPIKTTIGLLGAGTTAASKAIPVLAELATIRNAAITYKKINTAVTTANTAATIAETTATEVATAAQLLFNGALAANPIGAVAIAIGLVAAAIGTYALCTSEATGESDDFNDKIRETSEQAKEARDALNESGDAMKSAYDAASNSISDAVAQSALAEKLVKQLDVLTNKSSLTTEEQVRMMTVVEELNSIYPELGLEIEGTTGKLNKGTQEIKDYVKSMKDMTLAKAYMEAYKDIIDKVIEAQKKQIEAEMTLEDLQGELNEANEAYNTALGRVEKASKKVTKAQDEYDKVLNDTNHTQEEFEKVSKNLADAQNELEAAQNDLTESS
ncbi:MAG: phage tail tape measure protein, partial [Eubacteriales bacterium]|nr:phage tail tape measure protein [Eubacteriales bacterium]